MRSQLDIEMELTERMGLVKGGKRSRSLLPPLARMEMPVQSLRGTRRTRGVRSGIFVWLARLVAFGGGAFLIVHAGLEMWAAIHVGEPSAGQYAFFALFLPTFAWIAFSGTSALAALLAKRPREPKPPEPSVRSSAPRTALVMPVYNEDPADTAAALLVMGRGLAKLSPDRFEIFVISDTTNPEVWIRESAAIAELESELRGVMPVWYRRRYKNIARKSGNVEDFVERWGGRYESFVLLDADSLMAPETLIALSDAMHADPRLGLLQTVPRLAGGRGLWARMQQFAGRIYGPIVARGVAAWQGNDGNYWGHNAILRTSAFAASCGLPVLHGRKPFEGAILSHDFVEATLLRRAGWSVRMDPELEGSYEDSPPSLLDVAQRDRRWAQGNLQHSKVIGASGLAPISRFHLLIGIGSYLSSPLWLALILVGLTLAAIASARDPVYFTSPFQLFPDWPKFDSERLLYLFFLSLGVLLLPKVLGIARALFQPKLRKACGGGFRIVASGLVELLISSLYAPILMLIHTRQVIEILRGKDSGWAAQRRGDGGTPWSEAIRRHLVHTLVGIGATVLVFLFARPLIWWLSPTLAGLVLSILLSRWSGEPRIGDRLRHAGLFTIPEETEPPKILSERDRMLPLIRERLDAVDLERFATDRALRESHFAAVEPLPEVTPGEPDVNRLSAKAKADDAISFRQAWDWMTDRERLVLLSERTWYENWR